MKNLLMLLCIVMLQVGCGASFRSVEETAALESENSTSANNSDDLNSGLPGSGQKDDYLPTPVEDNGDGSDDGGDKGDGDDGDGDDGDGDDGDGGKGDDGDGGKGDDGQFVRLTVTVEFGPGVDDVCPYGGKKTSSGLDLNKNGQLEGGEVDNITYICYDKKDECCCCWCCYEDYSSQSGDKKDAAPACCCSNNGSYDSASHSDDEKDYSQCCYCCSGNGSYDAASHSHDDKDYGRCCYCCPKK